MTNITSIVEHITPEIAAEYLKLNKNNRKLHEPTVKKYVARIKSGQWKLNGETICFNEDGNLVQGQHRMSAVVEANMPIDILVVRGVANDCMATYDNGKSRSAGDVLYLSNIPDASKVSSLISRYLSLVKGYTQSGQRKTQCSNQTILDEYNASPEYYDEIKKFSVRLYKQYRLYTSSQFGGVIVFLNRQLGYSLDYIMKFFLELCGLSNTNYCPTIALLRDTIIRDMTSTRKYNSIYKHMLLIKTWNSYVKGVELKCLKWDEAREKKIEFQ